jgi:Fic family protein
MKDFTKESGKFSSGGVGIFTGEQLVHMAPSAHLVREQIERLIYWSKVSDVHPLIIGYE